MKAHRHNIMQKLNVGSVAEAASMAEKSGLSVDPVASARQPALPDLALREPAENVPDSIQELHAATIVARATTIAPKGKATAHMVNIASSRS